MGPVLKASSTENHPRQSIDSLIELISPWVKELGYRVIHLEIQSQRQKTLRVFIDFLEPKKSSEAAKGIGIEDCARVSRALDEPLEKDPQLLAAFPGSFELEVSSPGLDRPLRSPQDFQEFCGERVKIHVYRPLTADELGNADYQTKNPKQKNFSGILQGMKEDRVKLRILDKAQSDRPKKKKGRLTEEAAEDLTVLIPLQLISKANLDPEFDFEGSDERE